MGMDVYGKAASAEHGQYFRNNVWYWRPLWGYICTEFSELAGDDPEMGHYNDGYGLDADDATRLGHALLDAVESGKTEQFRLDYLKELAELPRTDCPHCEATGIRSDSIGREAGMPDKALKPEISSLVGREFGWCNGCDGIGTQEHFAHHYPFEVENVKAFGEFLLASGGFEIC